MSTAATITKDRIIAILASNDNLKAAERTDFATYIHAVFTKAEAFDTLTATISALTARVTALETK